jgi:pimeloyl-ACP methyl ester carboxylesterase
MNVIVNNLLVNYERKGSGKTILLLHGWADQLHTFDRMAKLIDEEYEVIRLDLPGFGKSQAPDGSWGLDDYVNHVAEFIRKIDVAPYAIAGHSNGGAIAIKGIASTKLRTHSLVLLSSAGIRNDNKLHTTIWGIIAKLGKAATFFMPSSARSALRERMYRSAGSDLTVAPHMEGTFKRIVGEDVRTAAAQVRVPTLIMNGSSDTATPQSYAETFHSLIQGSELVIIPDADHFVHQTHAGQVSDNIKGFLGSE